MALKKFSFNVIKKDSYARCGLIKTHRGNINTPAFMPVGTQATIKAAFIDDIIKTGSEIIGGKGGGGRPDFAQAGGVEVDKIDEAFEKLKSLI